MSSKKFPSDVLFERAPLLSLLPEAGDIDRLSSMGPSLLARYDSVSQLSQEEENSEMRARLRDEERMLRTALLWLGMRPDSPAGDGESSEDPDV